jgi:hypothetical protein
MIQRGQLLPPYRDFWATMVQSKNVNTNICSSSIVASGSISSHVSFEGLEPKKLCLVGASIGIAIAYGQKETDAWKWMTNFFGCLLHTTTLLDKLSVFMKV